MDQTKFYKLIALGLLLLNLLMITFFFLTKPNHGPQGAPGSFQDEVIQMFELDDQQESTFKNLARDHSETMRSLNEEQQKLLSLYFATMSDTSNTRDLTLTRIHEIEKEKVVFTNQHLVEIKNILKDSQLPHYARFMDKFLERIILKEKINQPPPKDF